VLALVVFLVVWCAWVGWVLWRVSDGVSRVEGDAHRSARLLENVSGSSSLALSELEQSRVNSLHQSDRLIVTVLELRDEAVQGRLDTLGILEELRAARASLEELREALESKAPRLMELPPSPSVNVTLSPEEKPVTWADLRRAGEARRQRQAEEQRKAEEEAEARRARAEALAKFQAGTLSQAEADDLPSGELKELQVAARDLRDFSNFRRTTRMDSILKAARKEEQ
jgi:hypothetical protein